MIVIFFITVPVGSLVLWLIYGIPLVSSLLYISVVSATFLFLVGILLYPFVVIERRNSPNPCFKIKSCKQKQYSEIDMLIFRKPQEVNNTAAFFVLNLEKLLYQLEEDKEYRIVTHATILRHIRYMKNRLSGRSLSLYYADGLLSERPQDHKHKHHRSLFALKLVVKGHPLWGYMMYLLLAPIGNEKFYECKIVIRHKTSEASELPNMIAENKVFPLKLSTTTKYSKQIEMNSIKRKADK